MAITPNEISNKEFKKIFRGYNTDEVDDFLEQIVDDYEKIFKENVTLKEEISNLRENIAHYSNMEQTLQNTLLLAQTAAEQAKENCRKETEIIIKEAQEKALEIVHDAEHKTLEINKQYEILKNEFTMFKSRFKGLLEAELGSIDKLDLDGETSK